MADEQGSGAEDGARRLVEGVEVAEHAPAVVRRVRDRLQLFVFVFVRKEHRCACVVVEDFGVRAPTQYGAQLVRRP
eukprot:2374370-Rhodomonas_salina.1